MQNNDEHNMPDPLDFVPGSVTSTHTESQDAKLQPQQFVAPKKHRVVKTVLSLIVAIPVVVVLIVIIAIASFSSGHNSELGKLETATTAVFSGASFAPSSYNCHDVELKNECFFTISKNDATVKLYLFQQGFTSASKYGAGYQKDDLYIEDGNNGAYQSYFIDQ